MATDALAPRRLPSEVGNWVCGERFWGRESEVTYLMQQLRDGANISIVAPRRSGKTSLMREVGRRLADEFTVLHIDLQKARCAEDLIIELSLATREHRDLWSRTREVFRNAFASVEEVDAKVLTVKLRDALVGDWRYKGDQLLGELAATGKPIVVFIDELAILVNRLLKQDDYQITRQRIAEVDLLMSWLRAATIQMKGRVRFVIAGSIGLAPILHQAGLSATMNTFQSLRLDAWDHPTALGALHALARDKGVQWGEGAPERALQLLGHFVPHHVQQFWAHLAWDMRAQSVFHVQTRDVDRVFERQMLGAQGHSELSHLVERLRLILGNELFPLAIQMLTEAAVAGSLSGPAAMTLAGELLPARASETVLHIIQVLEHDGYLQRDGNAYVFVSAYVKEWWRRSHQFTYRPIHERKVRA